MRAAALSGSDGASPFRVRRPCCWEGEAPAEPRWPLPARTEPRPGVVQSWDCTTLAFLPNSLRKFRERALFFPPLVKGGPGGVGR